MIKLSSSRFSVDSLFLNSVDEDVKVRSGDLSAIVKESVIVDLSSFSTYRAGSRKVSYFRSLSSSR